MMKHTALLTTLVLSLILLPGCPGVSPLVGTWILTYAGNDFGLELNANGEAVPFLVDRTLSGTLTWEVDGTRVVIHNDFSGNTIGSGVYLAELTSETAMEGAYLTWRGPDTPASGTFTAVKQ